MFKKILEKIKTIFKKIFKNKKRTIIILIVLLMVVPSLYNVITGKNKADNTAQIPTDTIQKRTLITSISATGSIVSSETQNIMTTLSGSQVKTVNVSIGDVVNIGDTICTFDTKTIQDNLNAAQKDINNINAQNSISMSNAQRSLTDTINSRNNVLDSTQKQINDSLNNYNATNVAIVQADAAVVAAKAEENRLSTIYYADPTNVKAKDEYEDAKAAREKAESAVADLQKAASGFLTAHQTAQSEYDKLVSAQNSAVTAAESAVKSTELSANTSTSAQQTQIRSYKEQLQKGVLTATTAGIVTAVNVKEGDIYAGSTIATIEGSENLIIEAEIDQYDISDIREGMKVYIKTDATRNEELQGIVTYTAPKATSASISATGTMSAGASTGSGDVTYKIKISLETPNDRLRLGMTARLSIITESKADVLSVPYDAVYDREDGTKFIKVKKENSEETEDIDVTVGMESNYYIEISSDKINEGMTVILPTVETDNSIESLVTSMGASGGM